MWIPCRTHFTRPAVCHLRLQAFRQLQASLTNLGLAICRAVTDLTPGFAFPPVLALSATRQFAPKRFYHITESRLRWHVRF
jgi:hypothetical protein